jgi:hypothetical protein
MGHEVGHILFGHDTRPVGTVVTIQQDQQEEYDGDDFALEIAQKLGIKKIHVAQQAGKIEFEEHPKINLQTLIKLIQVHAKRYQMEGPTRLRFTLDKTNNEERIAEVKQLLNT